MQIQAINNTNFKGLFTDRSVQNCGNWLMEYSPYSWESNNTGKMANQTDIDMYASSLPENDKIYTHNLVTRRKSAKDILGTEFYFENADGTMRRTITEVPEMNRENSLRVLDNKLGVFLDKKQVLKTELEKTFNTLNSNIKDQSLKYNNASFEYEKGYFDRSDSKSRLKVNMDKYKSEMAVQAQKMSDNIQKYINLINSIESTKQIKQAGLKELEIINEHKKAGTFIDISRRNIFNPNEALAAACNNMKTISEKVLCLPDRLVSMKSILEKLGHNYSADDVIRIVEKMIAR